MGGESWMNPTPMTEFSGMGLCLLLLAVCVENAPIFKNSLFKAPIGRRLLQATTAAPAYSTAFGYKSGCEVLVVGDYSGNKLWSLGVADGVAGSYKLIAGSGSLSTVSGTGSGASFYSPAGVGMHRDGVSVFLGEGGGKVLDRVTLATGASVVVAGSAGSTGTVDGVLGTNRVSQISTIINIAGTDDYLFCDQFGLQLRKFNTATGVVTTLKTFAFAPSNFDASNNGTVIYISSYDTANLYKYVITTDTLSVVMALPAPANAGVTLSPNGTLLFLPLKSVNKILVYNLITSTAQYIGSGVSGSADGSMSTATFFALEWASKVVFSRDATVMYVMQNNGVIRVIDASTYAVRTMLGANAVYGLFVVLPASCSLPSDQLVCGGCPAAYNYTVANTMAAVQTTAAAVAATTTVAVSICGPATYNSTVGGVSTCMACPANTGSAAGAVGCVPAAGYYLQGSVTRFPSAAMTAATTTIGGEVFVADASSVGSFTGISVYSPHAYDVFVAYQGFWITSVATYSTGSDGLYTGVFFTVVDGVVYKGEWIQLKCGIGRQLGSYAIKAEEDVGIFYLRTPTKFIIAGSNDGESWTALDTQTTIWTSAGQIQTFYPSPSMYRQFNTFRMIILAIGGNSDGYAGVSEWYMYAGTPTTCSAGSCSSPTPYRQCTVSGGTACCGAGTYWVPSATAAGCTPCPPGSYGDGSQTSCTSCPAYTSSVAGATSIINCTAAPSTTTAIPATTPSPGASCAAGTVYAGVQTYNGTSVALSNNADKGWVDSGFTSPLWLPVGRTGYDTTLASIGLGGTWYTSGYVVYIDSFGTSTTLPAATGLKTVGFLNGGPACGRTGTLSYMQTIVSVVPSTTYTLTAKMFLRCDGGVAYQCAEADTGGSLFKMLWSQDGQTWTQIYYTSMPNYIVVSFTSSAFTPTTSSIYIRLVGDSSNLNFLVSACPGYGVGEEYANIMIGGISLTPSSPTLVSLLKTCGAGKNTQCGVSASSTHPDDTVPLTHYYASNAIDGSTGSFWQASGKVNGFDWLRLDFESSRQITSLSLTALAGYGARLSKFRVYVGDDATFPGANLMVYISPNSDIGSNETTKFNAFGRYLYVAVTTANTGSNWMTIAELDVLGPSTAPQPVCTQCTSGSYCPASSTAAVPCQAGYYCATPSTQVQCPANFYCPSGATTPTACPTTTVSPVGSASASQCVCSNAQQTLINGKCSCPTGKFLIGGNCVTCPAGMVCGVSFDPLTCSLGSYCPTGATAEQPCQAGSYCTTPSTQVTCPANTYCPASSTAPIACVTGSVSPVGSTLLSQCSVQASTGGSITVDFEIDNVDPNLSQAQFQNALPSNVVVSSYTDVVVSGQTVCPTGYYCPADTTTPVPCPAGTYNSLTNKITVGDCLACPVGQFCTISSTLPVDCAAGSYRIVEGAQKQGDCTVCPSGNYCPVKSVTPTNCTAGTYEPTTGGVALASCLSCPVGDFCPIATTTPIQCAAGSYRGAVGGVDQSSCTTCPSGNFCPLGSVDPTNCTAGTYRASTGAMSSSDCLACPAGQYCFQATTTPVNCNAGSYRGAVGGVAQGSCTTCPSGNFCPIGSVNPTNCSAGTYEPATGGSSISNCLACPLGDYCPTATTIPIQCAAGSYQGATGGVAQSSCTTCPAGNYCPVGSIDPTNCSAGSYQGATGGIAQSSCTTCPTGNFCPIGSVNPTNCSAGTYEPATGGSSISNCLACPAGDYCPTATTTPIQCAAGSYQGATGGVAQSSCATCTTGNFCPLGSVDPTNCTAGTYEPATGGSSISNCLACPVGDYCPTATTTPTPCAAGSYRSTTGAGSQADCTQCPVGNFCPIQSVNPTQCVAGTFNPSVSRTNISDCLACDTGKYSLTVGSSTDCPFCAVGSFCVNPTTIQACPAHTTSNSGSSSLLNCRCLEGFQCSYTKQITATVTLNTSYSSFTSDAGGIQTLFKAQVAAAAGVSPSQVIIRNVAPKVAVRRLLGLSSPHQLIDVRMVVNGAERLRNLHSHLAKHAPFLYQGHTWAEAHRVSSQPSARRVGKV